MGNNAEKDLKQHHIDRDNLKNTGVKLKRLKKIGNGTIAATIVGLIGVSVAAVLGVITGPIIFGGLAIVALTGSITGAVVRQQAVKIRKELSKDRKVDENDDVTTVRETDYQELYTNNPFDRGFYGKFFKYEKKYITEEDNYYTASYQDNNILDIKRKCEHGENETPDFRSSVLETELYLNRTVSQSSSRSKSQVVNQSPSTVQSMANQNQRTSRSKSMANLNHQPPL